MVSVDGFELVWGVFSEAWGLLLVGLGMVWGGFGAALWVRGPCQACVVVHMASKQGPGSDLFCLLGLAKPQNNPKTLCLSRAQKTKKGPAGPQKPSPKPDLPNRGAQQ